MKELQETKDLRFATIPSLHPTYNNPSKSFEFALQLTNDLPDQLHFYIASTFGCCLVETTKVRCVSPHSHVVLKFSIKPTNLLGKVQEKLSIFGSKFKSAQLLRLNHCYVTSTQLVFNEENILDPAIEEILASEADSCLKQGHELKQTKELDKALSKYEEAYQIMRCSQQATNQMISCRLSLKDFEGALRDVETALMWQMNVFSFLLTKVNILMVWKDINISEHEEIQKTIKQTLEFLQMNSSSYEMSPQEKARLSQVQDLFKQYSQFSEGKVKNLLRHVVNTAIDKVAEDSPVLKFYGNKGEFEQELRQLLLQHKQEHCVTPEEILDPIGYEIMNKPCILPSGNSCEQRSLRAYFTTNGYKDPITRQPINYELVFKNLNLQSYIKENPLLKKWQKYQFDYLHH